MEAFPPQSNQTEVWLALGTQAQQIMRRQQLEENSTKWDYCMMIKYRDSGSEENPSKQATRGMKICVE